MEEFNAFRVVSPSKNSETNILAISTTGSDHDHHRCKGFVEIGPGLTSSQTGGKTTQISMFVHSLVEGETKITKKKSNASK